MLTNTWGRLFDYSWNQGLIPNVDFEIIVKSHQERLIKPEREIFELAALRAGVKPEEIFLIDDKPVNIEAAKSLGWQRVVFKPYQPLESVQ